MRAGANRSTGNATARGADAGARTGLIRRTGHRRLAERHPIGAAVVLLLSAAAIVAAWMRPWSFREAPAASAPGSYQVQALTLSGDASLGAVSADGKFVAYVRRIGMESSIWVRQIPGGAETQRVAPVPGRQFIGLTITPGGDIDFVAREGLLTPSLSRIPLVGAGEPRGVISDVWSATGWAPDGRHQAFVRADFSQRMSSVVVADPDGSNQRVLANRNGSPGFLGAAYNSPTPTGRPVWSRDGHFLIAVAWHRCARAISSPRLRRDDRRDTAHRPVGPGLS